MGACHGRLDRSEGRSSSLGWAILLLVGALLAGCSGTKTRDQPAQGVSFTPPDQFVVDKENDLAAIVKVTRSESRWVILPDGDHFPLVVAQCEMQEALSGAKSWPAGTTQPVMQVDYSNLISEPIAPPAIEGRRYILWAEESPIDSELPPLAPWTAHPQGLLLVRRQGGQEFVFWNGKSYALSAIRNSVKAGQRLPLDQIVDPARRLAVAQERMSRGQLGDEKAVLQGLLVNVLDPDGQSKMVERSPKVDATADTLVSQGQAQPHALWYTSLALLRDLGKDDKRRRDVVAALTPIAHTARERVRLAASLALVDLGSDAGREALIRGFESDSGQISSDPPDPMIFMGRYPFDESSVTACAHALARLGDQRGLKHAKPEVRLAAAEALKDSPSPELRKALETLATELEPDVVKLRASGKLNKLRRPGDYRNRYPETWVRTHGLLARLGDDRSLRRLIEAYVVDAATYPREEAPLIPTGRSVSWSSGRSLAEAIHGADANPAHLLDRIRGLFGKDPRWDTAALKSLRASPEQPTSEKPKEPVRHKPSQAEITRLLGDSNPSRRAEGLIAAGYHQIDAFYDKVLDVALRGKGGERNAAIYALGFYDRDVPEAALRQLFASGDQGVLYNALELATRRHPARFARESMDIVRVLVKQSKKGGSSDGVAYLPRILCRLARGPLPEALVAGLKDPDSEVRRTVVLALQLAGNPDGAQYLEPVTHDADSSTREAAKAALALLGPSGSTITSR